MPGTSFLRGHSRARVRTARTANRAQRSQQPYCFSSARRRSTPYSTSSVKGQPGMTVMAHTAATPPSPPLHPEPIPKRPRPTRLALSSSLRVSGSPPCSPPHPVPHPLVDVPGAQARVQAGVDGGLQAVGHLGDGQVVPGGGRAWEAAAAGQQGAAIARTVQYTTWRRQGERACEAVGMCIRMRRIGFCMRHSLHSTPAAL